MKLRLLAITGSLLGPVLAGTMLAEARADQQMNAADQATIALVGSIADALAKGDAAFIVKQMSPEMAQALPAPKIASVWQGIIAQIGAYRGRDDATLDHQGEIAIVAMPLHFEKAVLDLRVSIQQQQVAGFWIVNHKAPVPPWQAPTYVKPGVFLDVEVSIGNAPMALPGTLSLPARPGKVPALILVHGSGPGDRDESVGAVRPFRDLAEGLASRGIAVLRYEKRTKLYPQAFVALKHATVRDETMDDVRAAIALLKARAEIDPAAISVLGHSLGGTLAPRIAAEYASVASIVVLAGATRPLPAIVVAQVKYLASLQPDGGAGQAAHIQEIQALADRALAAKADQTGDLILGAPPSYWADLNAYDPATTAAALKIPMLILQGGRDYQVTLDDLDRFQKALAGHPNASIHVLPSLNHLFVAGSGRSMPAEYELPGHVDGAVIDLIASFILAQKSP